MKNDMNILEKIESISENANLESEIDNLDMDDNNIEKKGKDFKKRSDYDFDETMDMNTDKIGRNWLIKRLTNLQDGSEYQTFNWYCDIPYRSQLHEQIIDGVIDDLRARKVIRERLNTDPNGLVAEPAVTEKLADTLSINTSIGYDIGAPFPEQELPEIYYEHMKDLLDKLISNPIPDSERSNAYIRRNSSSGYCYFDNTMSDKWPPLLIAFKQMFNKFKGPYSRPINVKFMRRQHNSISDKEWYDPRDKKMKPTKRAMKKGYMPRIRIVQGCGPLESAVAAYIQTVRHYMDKLLFDMSEKKSFSEDFHRKRVGYPITLDVQHYESKITKRLKIMVCEAFEKWLPDLDGLSGWKSNTITVFKSFGKIWTTMNLSQESGSALTYPINQLFSIVLHSVQCQQAGLTNGIEDFFAKHDNIFEEFILSGDDSLLAFKSAEMRQRYVDVAVANGMMVPEIPSGFLGQKVYGVDNDWYLDYDVDRLAGGLLNREKESTSFYYLSALAKTNLLSRSAAGREFLQSLDKVFKDLTGITYLDYAKLRMTDEEIDIINNDVEISDMVNIAFINNPDSIHYKTNTMDISHKLLDMFYFTLEYADMSKFKTFVSNYENSELEKDISDKFDNLSEIVKDANLLLAKKNLDK